MCESTANRNEASISWFEPRSNCFRLLFPDLAELVRVGAMASGVAVRSALERMKSWARQVLRQSSGSEHIVTPDDVVSETLIRIEMRGVLLNYASRRGRADSLVYGTIRNVARELTRKHREAHSDERFLALADDDAGPLENVIRKEELSRLRAAISRLTCKEREALRRKYEALFGAEGDPSNRCACDYARRSRALARLRILLMGY